MNKSLKTIVLLSGIQTLADYQEKALISLKDQRFLLPY